MSISSKSYIIIIDSEIIAPGHRREFVDGLNATYKSFIFHLMVTVQLPGSKRFDTQMEVHTETQNTDVSLSQEFKKHLSNKQIKPGIIDNRKHKKGQVNKIGKSDSIM